MVEGGPMSDKPITKKEMENRLETFFKRNLPETKDWMAIINLGPSCGLLNTSQKTIEKQTKMLTYLLKFCADTSNILYSHTDLPLFKELAIIQENQKEQLLDLINQASKVKGQK
jgi:hypothetical protein